jgi:hypothetical protein
MKTKQDLILVPRGTHHSEKLPFSLCQENDACIHVNRQRRHWSWPSCGANVACHFSLKAVKLDLPTYEILCESERCLYVAPLGRHDKT